MIQIINNKYSTVKGIIGYLSTQGEVFNAYKIQSTIALKLFFNS